MIHEYAYGNFRIFAREMGKTGAMLSYLNGNLNVAGNPNENYARELMELFTMGESNGYTQQDIVEMARALTGWQAVDYPLHEDTAEARDARRRLLHSIGNLTLVTPGYNSTLSNRAFAEKHPEIAANSSLMLNSYFQGLSDQDVWDEAALQKRAKGLLPLAIQLWPCPASSS